MSVRWNSNLNRSTNRVIWKPILAQKLDIKKHTVYSIVLDKYKFNNAGIYSVRDRATLRDSIDMFDKHIIRNSFSENKNRSQLGSNQTCTRGLPGLKTNII